MKKFGSSIRYLLVDLINIYNKYGAEEFENRKNIYLNNEKENKDSYFYKLTAVKMEKLIEFINENVDSLTCENEMKMECYFNENEPAFINDKVNTKLFNFSYADKIYNFAQENGLDMRIHTIVWYRHVPKQLIEYIDGRTLEDKRRLTLDFIGTYMRCLAERYPNCYCVDVINEMAADFDELKYLEQENEPLYEYDDEGIRIDFWYKALGKHYYIEIFKMARDIFGDNIKLFYNDNNEGNKEKQQTYLKIFKNIKKYELDNKVKILDGFGMQSHYWGDETETKEYMEELYSFYTDLDIEIQITEFDVSNHSTKEQQLNIFYNFIEVIKKYDIDVFTMWGLNDELSWLSEYNPVLVDNNFDIKDFAKDYINHFSNKQKIQKK